MYDFNKSAEDKQYDATQSLGTLHDVPEFLVQGAMPSELFAPPPPPVGESALPEEASPTQTGYDAVGGAMSAIGGGYQVAHGIDEIEKGGETNIVDGSLDVAGGGAGIVGGGASLLGSLGMESVGDFATAAGPALGVLGTVISGDHQAESMSLFHDDDGKPIGAVQAAYDEAKDIDHATSAALGGGVLGDVAGAVVGGGAGYVMEQGAAVADFGLGYEALGASSGMFGTATAADGTTHNMGAFEALDHAGKAAGEGVDSFLGLDPDSTSGEIVGGATHALVDGVGSTAAVIGDMAGGVVGAGEAAASWVGDLF